ncbi:hypothetical protein TNCV_1171241 [Trichonephila clavipes]|nr:hypothetical protein TNCV_1171241 [Trichonephila clavipes]
METDVLREGLLIDTEQKGNSNPWTMQQKKQVFPFSCLLTIRHLSMSGQCHFFDEIHQSIYSINAVFEEAFVSRATQELLVTDLTIFNLGKGKTKGEDMLQLAEELGINATLNMTVPSIKIAITNSEGYEEEFVKNL